MQPGSVDAVSTRTILGEGPVWDPERRHLTWVDIVARRVHTWSPADSRQEVRELPEEVSLALPCASGRRLVSQVTTIALDDGVRLQPLCAVDAGNPHTRLNDGRCDDSGRLWVGTYSTRGEAEAALHVVSPDGEVTTAVEGLVAANGIAWSPDRATLYVADTGRCRIERYAVGEDPFGLAHLDPLAVTDPARGRPDGLTVDAEGGVWVALWGAARLHRYAADGTLSEVVPLPVTYPTSVAFGGDALDTLYVTSSVNHLPDPDAEPLAGRLLAVTPRVRGLAEFRFGA